MAASGNAGRGHVGLRFWFRHSASGLSASLSPCLLLPASCFLAEAAPKRQPEGPGPSSSCSEPARRSHAGSRVTQPPLSFEFESAVGGPWSVRCLAPGRESGVGSQRG